MNNSNSHPLEVTEGVRFEIIWRISPFVAGEPVYKNLMKLNTRSALSYSLSAEHDSGMIADTVGAMAAIAGTLC
jgi:hypothetical protein